MNETEHEGPRWGIESDAGAWRLDRRTLWTWIEAALDGVGAAQIESSALKGLCAQVLDTHAPAALVYAQAAGIALEHLVAAAIAQSYTDRFGPARGRFLLTRLRAVVGELQGERRRIG